MKRLIAITLTGVFFLMSAPGTIWAAGTTGSIPAKTDSGSRMTPQKEDTGVQQYLEEKGDALKDKMENVMEPMKKGEGIRGTTQGSR